MQRAAALLLALVLGLGAAAVQAQVCQTYVVQQGDTVNIIADKFDVTPKALEDALVSCVRDYQPGVTFLQPSQKICLPGWVNQCQYVADAGQNPSCKYYKVQPGDTIDTISQYFTLPRQDIEGVNPDLNPSTLPVASFVKLPPWGAECPAPGDNKSCRVYVAQSGDSLSAIATAFSIALSEVQAANGGVDGTSDGSTILQPGQRIKLPPFPDTCGAGVPVPKPSNCRAYIVTQGDTLSMVAAMFQTTTAELIAINPTLAEGVLSPNTQVLLPPSDPQTCVTPEIVSGIPSPPMPPSPPPMPPMPPSPPKVESPPPAPQQEAPTGAPAPAPSDAPAEGPAEVPAPQPAAEPPAPVEEPTAPAPAPATSAAAAATSRALLAALAVLGAAALLF